MTAELGKKYRDIHTGFEGIATGRTEFLYGCVRVCLESVDNDGVPQEVWFDEQRLTDQLGTPVETTARSGGPQGTPPRRRDPSR